MIKKKIILLAPLFLLVSSSAHANYVNSTINVNNNVSSSSTSDSNCHTNITTETNGKVTHYESENCGNISTSTVNGNTEIKENGQTVDGTSTTVDGVEQDTNNLNPTPTDHVSPTPTIKHENKENARDLEFRDRIIEQLKLPLRIFWGFFAIFHR